jgi:ABC-type nitrate/sulfonate/bicarbonate transport system ATPase subunit
VHSWSVTLDAVSFKYARHHGALFSNFSLVLAPGSRVSIIGPSGSGKTTLLLLLAGLNNPASGRISFEPNRPRVGMLPQDDLALPWRSVWRNLTLVRHAAFEDHELEVLLDGVGLPRSQFGSRFPDQLSGGERRRLGLAMVLASRPQLILLDEASSSLDERTRFSVVDRLLQALAATSAGLVAITHDIEEALLLGDTLLIFDGKGAIRAQPILLPSMRTSQMRFLPEFQTIRAQIAMQVRG